MSICRECAWEADVLEAVRSGARKTLPRRGVFARRGHSACDGCPCQHRPPGSWKGNRS